MISIDHVRLQLRMHQVMIFTAALVQLYRVELAVIKAFNYTIQY